MPIKLFETLNMFNVSIRNCNTTDMTQKMKHINDTSHYIPKRPEK